MKTIKVLKGTMVAVIFSVILLLGYEDKARASEVVKPELLLLPDVIEAEFQHNLKREVNFR